MDVSRIEAISPKQIDWRKLTAKEIIKYDNQGVNVPLEYLQWAKEFRADLTANDKDETTYDTMGTSQAVADPTYAEAHSSVNAEGSEEGSDESQNLTAKERRDKLLEEKSYYGVAKIFSEESKNKAQYSESAEALLNNTGNKSDNETENIESSIRALMEEADELKSKIESLKNKSSNDKGQNNTSKILQLQRQIKQLGQTGQVMAAGVDADLNEYKSVIEAQYPIGDDAVDTGNVTVEMGEVIKKWPFFFDWVGERIVESGENAINKGDLAKQAAVDASDRNSQNLSQIGDLKNDIEGKTGVQAVSFTNEDVKAKNAKNEDKKDSSSSKTAEDQQIAIASGSIDEIMKYKIRKGEINQNS